MNHFLVVLFQFPAIPCVFLMCRPMFDVVEKTFWQTGHLVLPLWMFLWFWRDFLFVNTLQHMSHENSLFSHIVFKYSGFSKAPEIVQRIKSTTNIFSVKTCDEHSCGPSNLIQLKNVYCIFHKMSSLYGCFCDSGVPSCLSNFYHIRGKKIV